jgi:yecA family protein
MSTPLDQLLRLLKNDGVHVDKPTLHGFLTALTVGPGQARERFRLEAFPGVSRLDQVSADPERVGQLMDAVTAQILEALDADGFEPCLGSGRDRGKATIGWCRGFCHALALAGPEWEALHAEHTEALKPYAMILALQDAEVAETLLGVPKAQHKEFAAEIAPTLGLTLDAYANALLGEPWEEDVAYEPAPELTLEDLPKLDPQVLADSSNDRLYEQVLELGDCVPRELAHEMVARGDLMAERLCRFVEDDDLWLWADSSEQQWAKVHAVMILGAMGTPTASRGLLRAFQRLCETWDEYEPQWEWLDDYWPSLFYRARTHTTEALRALAQNTSLGWPPRLQAALCLLSILHSDDSAAFEAELDQLAQWAADAESKLIHRAYIGTILLDAPRERHRPLLEKLGEQALAELDWRALHPDEIKAAFERGTDAEAFDNLVDPLCFYDPEEVLARLEMGFIDEDFPLEDNFFDTHDNVWDIESHTPLTRDRPKVGRNDPCPCGSGKKYKNCCLNKDHE